MAFERFTQTQSFKPKLSIWGKGGQLGFNQGAMNKYGLANFRYAILFYDRDKSRIGIKFTNDENEEGIVKFKPRTTGGVIAGKTFLDHYKINYAETKNYDVLFDQENDLYIINLE